MLKIAKFSFSLALSLLLFTVISGISRIWEPNGTIWLSSSMYLLIPIAILFLVSSLSCKLKLKQLTLEPEPFCAGLLLVFFSDWLCRGYAFLQGPEIRGEIILGAGITLLCLRYDLKRIFAYFGVAALGLMASAFLCECGERLIWSDDHASFYYRLMLLKENFPNIPFYNPLWNGGIESREFFPSGILNVFFLTFPLIYLFKVSAIYNIIIAILMFVIPPLSTFLACRYINADYKTALIAALLATISSLTWYEWALVYGTIGFMTSIALMPLVLALGAKVLDSEEELNFKSALLLVIVTSLMLFWTMSGVAILPLIVLGVLSIRRILRKRYTLGIILALFLINSPWIVIFVQASNVFSFMQSEKTETVTSSSEQNLAANTDKEVSTSVPVTKRNRYKHKASGIEFAKTKWYLRQKTSASNPLFCFLALPGFFLMRRSSRKVWIWMTLWLLFIGSVLVPVKPQLELERMLVVLLYLFSVPVALTVSEIFKRVRHAPNALNSLAAICVGGFIFASPFSVCSVVRNHTLEQFRFKNYVYDSLVDAIKTTAPADGRVIFSGFIMHDLSDGHVAPLAMDTMHPLIASSYHHDKWWYTDVVPVEFLKKGDDGYEEFFDLYNVKAVIAHEPKLKALFSSKPDLYKEVWHAGHNRKFRLFKRLKYNGDYFLEGEGEILEQTTNHVTLKLKTRDALLKFTYLPFIEPSACEIGARQVSESLKFIELKNCPTDTEITLKSKSNLKRFFLEPLTGKK